MKRILALILILPALALAQARFGHGAMSPSQMLPIIADAIADSNAAHGWTAGTNIHAIKPRGGKSVQADSILAAYLRVTGDTQLDGNLTMNTVASESLKVLAGGIRNEGGLIQKGNSSFGLQQTPKSTVQVTGNGISEVNYYKGLRLSNPDAATVGVQALSPALVFRGAGWKTDATAGSDSVLWGIYVLPTQGTAAPGTRLYFNKKVGSASWSSPFFIDEFGNGTFAGSVISGVFLDAASTFYISSTKGQSLGGGTQEVILGGRYYSPADMDYETFVTTGTGGKTNIMGWGIDKTFASAPDSVKMALTETGNLGIGTTTPAALLHVNNANVLSKSLFRLGRDKNATPDSVSLMVTGMGKVSIGPNIAKAGMTPADTLNLVNIMGKKSADSLFVVHNDIVGRDSVFAVLPTGGITAATIKVGASNFTTTQIDTVFTAGFVPRWVKFTSGAKSWYSPVYADTTGKW